MITQIILNSLILFFIISCITEFINYKKYIKKLNIRNGIFVSEIIKENCNHAVKINQEYLESFSALQNILNGLNDSFNLTDDQNNAVKDLMEKIDSFKINLELAILDHKETIKQHTKEEGQYEKKSI
jgi:hypothetical protein